MAYFAGAAFPPAHWCCRVDKNPLLASLSLLPRVASLLHRPPPPRASSGAQSNPTTGPRKRGLVSYLLSKFACEHISSFSSPPLVLADSLACPTLPPLPAARPPCRALIAQAAGSGRSMTLWFGRVMTYCRWWLISHNRHASTQSLGRGISGSIPSCCVLLAVSTSFRLCVNEESSNLMIGDLTI